MSAPEATQPAASWRFPRGKGALPPPLFAEIQRHRIATAFVAVCAESGYAKLTTTAVAKAAGVSNATLYQHFPGKSHCLHGAFALFATELREQIDRACLGQPDWPGRVRAAIATVLDFAAAAPLAARFLCSGARAGGFDAASRVDAALAQLAAGLRRGRRGNPFAAQLIDATEEQIVASLAACLDSHLLAGAPERLPDLAPQFTALALAPYLGWEQAEALAGGPGASPPADGSPSPPALPSPAAAPSPALVDSLQRRRVFDSLLALSAESGYGALTLNDLLLHAHMAAATFYDLFADLEDCLLAAYATYAGQLRDDLLAAWEAGEDWPDRVHRAIRAALAFATAHPDVALLLTIEVQAGGPAARTAQAASLSQLAAKLREGRRHCPAAAALHPATEDVVVAGLAALLGERLLAGRGADLAPLAADLTALALAPFMGWHSPGKPPGF